MSAHAYTEDHRGPVRGAAVRRGLPHACENVNRRTGTSAEPRPFLFHHRYAAIGPGVMARRAHERFHRDPAFNTTLGPVLAGTRARGNRVRQHGAAAEGCHQH